ncbi:alpha-ketoglutarate-dependent sulfonate dioxygenase [Coniophora puteana RWD-64-598 SS2]|uniref:Alpha-ketoglutarate-dependent sulfonate dioxygenase n=1 Tax=Coniophora puteana (strain RWD-64-598) TaxID=741705 RepID=A0A5M3MRT0_CONPW|nr:alpha-ketoglutarate-dependent sulfonate dioxygenase [Coniophora puteana RWD-64-598 SS2]EIW81863.1 alpha-ketoglutarate-dependent sulfonate dioxygenase [Coniophora puteana RWD-64-598 SS2]
MATTTETVTETTQTLASLPLNKSDESEQQEEYRYAHLLPHFDASIKYPPLVPFEHVDPGSRALKHADPRAFLDGAEKIVHLTPRLGTEVRGVDLLKLDSDGRDQLALEVARRGLLVFRGQQEFINAGPEAYLEWGRYFGRLHIHPTTGHPKDHPELHLVYVDANSDYNFGYEGSITMTGWHSDVSYELQPPGLTTFFLLDFPPTGGDTLFTSQVSTLRRLSPPFVEFLRTLSVVHSGVDQANRSRAGGKGGVVRREPVEHVHPLVRKHPVTGEEALYVNKGFSRRIVGLKKEESEALLNFLYNHIAASGDLQARVKWEPGTVVVWDNRITAHSAIVDYGESKARRHGVRVTPQAERPIPALEAEQ